MAAFASHHCVPGSISGRGVICGSSLLFILVPASRVFLRVHRFSFLHNNKHSKFQFDPRISSSRQVKMRVTSIKYLFVLLIHLLKMTDETDIAFVLGQCCNFLFSP